VSTSWHVGEMSLKSLRCRMPGCNGLPSRVCKKAVQEKTYDWYSLLID